LEPSDFPFDHDMNLIIRSIYLDWELIRLNIPLARKVEFLFKKYLLLMKNYTVGFISGMSFIKLWSGKYFYEDKFGISFLQSVYVDNAFLEKFVSPGSVIVDIGANIGQFHHFAKYFLHSRLVYSFEPVRETYNLLKKNFNLNSYNYAIGIHKHHVFFIPETSLMASQYPRSISDKKKNISEIKLDSIREIRKEKVIDLLKIDTEGNELEALMGCLIVRSKTKYLLVETSINRDSYGDITKMLNYISKSWKNFRLDYIGRPYYINGVLESVDLLFKNIKLGHEK
jgi:FkbM family methyltransferase